MGLDQEWSKLTKEEQDEFIDLMLANDELQRKIKDWNKHPKSEEKFFDMIYDFKNRVDENAGFIVAMESDEVLSGVHNIEFATGKQCGKITIVEADKHKKYAMVYTNKATFEKSCNELSGLVMFIDDILKYVEGIKEVDGIIINEGTDNVLFSKMMIRAVLGALE